MDQQHSIPHWLPSVVCVALLHLIAKLWFGNDDGSLGPINVKLFNLGFVTGVANEPVPSLSHSTPFPASPASTNCGSLLETEKDIEPLYPKSKS